MTREDARFVVCVDTSAGFNGVGSAILDPFARFPTLLRATLERLAHSGLPVTLCIRDTRDSDRAAEAAAGLAIQILRGEATLTSVWIERALKETDAKAAILIDPHAAFVSPTLARAQLALHFARGADITLTTLVGRGMAGVVVDQAAVPLLIELEANRRKFDFAFSFMDLVTAHRVAFNVAYLEPDSHFQSIWGDLAPTTLPASQALGPYALPDRSEDYEAVLAVAAAREWENWPTISAKKRSARPKIIFVHYTSSLQPGSSHTFAQAVTGWDKENYEVQVVLPGDGPLTQMLAPFAAIHALAYSLPGEGTISEGATQVERVREFLEREKPDLVFVSNPSPAFSMACRLRGVPVVCHLKICYWLTAIEGRDTRASGSLLGSYDLIITNSEWHERGLRSLLRPPPGRMVGVPDGIDLKRFTPKSESDRAAAKRSLGLPDGKMVLIAGTLSLTKRTLLAVDVLAELLPLVPDAYLLLVGGDREIAGHSIAVRERGAQLGVLSRMIFTGHQEDMTIPYAAADVLLHPCLVESFGLVIVEAMAMQLPVVAMRSGALGDIVQDGVTGRLIAPPGDPKEIASALTDILNAPSTASEMGRAGREHAERLFDHRTFVERLQAAVAGLLHPPQ
jgi:glycosyltransferase involved in cell wall biosynthesis